MVESQNLKIWKNFLRALLTCSPGTGEAPLTPIFHLNQVQRDLLAFIDPGLLCSPLVLHNVRGGPGGFQMFETVFSVFRFVQGINIRKCE